MSLAGWNLKYLDVHPIATSKATRWCGADSFWGYNYGRKVGKITYIFKGDGEAKLNFGNCFTKGTAKVYLNKDKRLQYRKVLLKRIKPQPTKRRKTRSRSRRRRKPVWEMEILVHTHVAKVWQQWLLRDVLCLLQ